MGCLLEMLDWYGHREANQQDEMVWCLEEDKGFTIRSMCEALGPTSQISFLGECVWNSHVQSKAPFLLWEFWWNKIPTLDNLCRRGLMLPNWCCLCKGGGELAGHTFLHCPWSTPFWDYFINKFGVGSIVLDQGVSILLAETSSHY